MKEVLRTELAKKGIFLTDSQHHLQQPHQQTFESTLLILSKIGSLFYDPGELHIMTSSTYMCTEKHADGPSLSELLPIGQASPFHRFFINYCIEHQLARVLVEYLEYYKLGKTPDETKALDANTDQPWVNLLFQFRFQNNLFEASLANAQFCLQVFIAFHSTSAQHVYY